MNFLKKSLFVFVFLSFIFSCRKATTANWDVDLVIPVTNSEVNISNYLGDTILKADQTGLFHFIVNREIAALKLDSLLKLPDTTIVNSFTVPAFVDFTFAPGEAIPGTAPSETKFDLPNGIQLRKIEIRKSFLSVKFSNTVNQPLDMVFSFPGITKNNKTFEINETIPTGTNTLVKTYDLAGYTFNMTGLNGKVFNTIVQSSSVSVSPNAPDKAVIKWGQGIIMELSYTDVIPEFVEGYFGQQTLELPNDTTLLDIYQNFTADNFMLSDATFKFSIINEIGADFSGSIKNLSSFNSTKKKNILMSGNQLNRLNINAASRANRSINASTLAVTFNTVNSNVTAFVSNLPDKLSYSGTVTINPLGDLVKNYNQFAFYNTGVRLWADIDIPVRFSANYFNLISESKVDFSNVMQFDDFNFGNFVITCSNSFPFAAELQAYLLNSNQQIIDSLLIPGNNRIEYGDVDQNNIVINERKSVINVGFDRAKIENLKQTKSIKLKSKVILPPNPPDIQILERYKIKIGIVAELNYNAKISR